MFFDEAAAAFGWPIEHCSELSPQTTAACKKLEQKLLSDDNTVNVYALPREPDQRNATTKGRSLALVCEFHRRPNSETLRKAHELAWNLCEGEQILFLISDERTVQAWSTLVTASEWKEALLGEEVTLPARVNQDGYLWENQLLKSFHWINLVSDSFAKQYPSKFNSNKRADHLLIENLRTVRRELLTWPDSPEHCLPRECCHNLLARLIFVQYLFQRTDSKGLPFLSQSVMKKLANDEILTTEYDSLAGLLRHKGDTYELFRWLNDRFNGDLFPSASSGTISREIKLVRAEHLRRLANYLDGTADLSSGQGLLWEHYSFGIIPINFISSLYEEFLTEDERGNDKAHYTPPHLVDFILDTALPWNSTKWDQRILDPCCGSGIFIVKAFQRLAHRWKLAHPDQLPTVADLRKLLQNNVIGVDKNAEAVRVASFSLCLAMADEIDPRQYWKQTVFPSLRGENLIVGDFFDPETDTQTGIADSNGVDLVIGNPPWGKNSAKDLAKTWAKKNGWAMSNNDIGPLFLAKALSSAKQGGDVAIIQPGGLLMNQSGPIQKIRNKIYDEAKLVEVNNFSALRFGLFSKAIGPCCVLYLINEAASSDDVITYLCPKIGGANYVKIEPADWHEITRPELTGAPWIWTALMWGESRSFELIKRLEKLPSLQSEKDAGNLKTREGIIRGNRKQKNEAIVERKIIDQRTKFDSLNIDCGTLPTNDDLQVDSAASTDFSAFQFPQLIIKQSWTTKKRRFIASKVEQGKETKGILCTDSFVSVHSKDEDLLGRAWLVFNSCISVWWQLLRSGRLSTFIPQPLERELRLVPLPEKTLTNLSSLTDYSQIDQTAKDAFSLTDTEWALIQDIFNFTLADFKDGENSVGRQATTRDPKQDPLLTFAEWLMNVFEAGLGHRRFSATIFHEDEQASELPLRLIGIHLKAPPQDGKIEILKLADSELLNLLGNLHQKIFKSESENTKGFCVERHLRLYDLFTPSWSDEPVPTVFIAKPDRQGVWTRTAAMRDADEILSDILSPQSPSPQTT